MSTSLTGSFHYTSDRVLESTSQTPLSATEGFVCLQFTKSERQSQSQGKPFCLLPGTHKLALPLPHSRSLPGAPDHPFLLYNLRCRHFYRDCIHRGDLTDLQEQGPGETVGLSREGAGEEIRGGSALHWRLTVTRGSYQQGE